MWRAFTDTNQASCLATRAARAGRTCLCIKEMKMPKLKTKSGVKKRFKLTATAKVKHGVAGKRHRLIRHNAKYIRTNRGTTVLSEAEPKTVKKGDRTEDRRGGKERVITCKS